MIRNGELELGSALVDTLKSFPNTTHNYTVCSSLSFLLQQSSESSHPQNSNEKISDFDFKMLIVLRFNFFSLRCKR